MTIQPTSAPRTVVVAVRHAEDKIAMALVAAVITCFVPVSAVFATQFAAAIDHPDCIGLGFSAQTAKSICVPPTVPALWVQPLAAAIAVTLWAVILTLLARHVLGAARVPRHLAVFTARKVQQRSRRWLIAAGSVEAIAALALYAYPHLF